VFVSSILDCVQGLDSDLGSVFIGLDSVSPGSGSLSLDLYSITPGSGSVSIGSVSSFQGSGSNLLDKVLFRQVQVFYLKV